MEDSAPEGEIISNQAREVEISTMEVIKFSDAIKFQELKYMVHYVVDYTRKIMGI